MRTVTFANDEVRETLNRDFIAVWNNHSSHYNSRGVQPVYTEQQVAAYPEGGGTGNLRTYIATPDGRVISEIQGFWRADRFLSWLRFARDLTPKNAREHHTILATAVKKEATALKAAHPAEMKLRIRQSKIRKRIAALDLYARWINQSSHMNHGPVKTLLARVRLEASIRVIS